MEHIYIKELEDGFYELRPYEGYILWNENTQRKFSEAITKSTKDFVAILNGIPPEPHERTLEDAKKEKLAALKSYDSSNAVNSFILNGSAMWITPSERANYMVTIEGAKRNGLSAVSFLGQTIPVDIAISMIDAVNIYAMQCVGVTQTHENNIMALTTISEVDNYDFTIGYPQKLSF